MRVQNYRVGEHLKVSRGLYSHHMLYIGRGKVIHYSGWVNGPFDSECAKVEIACLQDVARESPVFVVEHHRRKHAGHAAVERAMKRLDERAYHVVFNNCEHLVHWAIDGVHRSTQVEAVTKGMQIVLSRSIGEIGIPQVIDGPISATTDELYKTFGAVYSAAWTRRRVRMV